MGKENQWYFRSYLVFTSVLSEKVKLSEFVAKL